MELFLIHNPNISSKFHSLNSGDYFSDTFCEFNYVYRTEIPPESSIFFSLTVRTTKLIFLLQFVLIQKHAWGKFQLMWVFSSYALAQRNHVRKRAPQEVANDALL